MDQDRDQFLASAKERARAYLGGPQPYLALASLIDDFSQRPDMADHVAVVMQLGMPLLTSGHLDTRAALGKFIDDFQ